MLRDERLSIENVSKPTKIENIFTCICDDGAFWKMKNGEIYHILPQSTCKRTVKRISKIIYAIIDIQFNGKWGIILCQNPNQLLIFSEPQISDSKNEFHINHIVENRVFHKYEKQKVSKVAIGSSHCLFLDESGTVRSGGPPYLSNISYSWNSTKTYENSKIVNFSDSYVTALRQLLCVNGFVRKYFGIVPMEIINLLMAFVPNFRRYFSENSFYEKVRINDIKCGKDNNLALDQNGNVYVWYRQIVQGESAEIVKSLMNYNVIEIDCGDSHFYAKTDGNEHFLWGNNVCNQCLTFDGRKFVDDPFCINETVRRMTGCDLIYRVSLGVNRTQIIVKG